MQENAKVAEFSQISPMNGIARRRAGFEICRGRRHPLPLGQPPSSRTQSWAARRLGGPWVPLQNGSKSP